MHVKRGHQGRRSHQPFHPVAQGGTGQFLGQNAHLQRCGAAKVVEQRHVIPGGDMGRQTIHHHRHGGAGGGEIDLFHPGLAVNAQPKLGLAGIDALFFR